MSHTNSTTNYKLPQFLGTDKPSWLNDINPAMLSIDTAIKTTKDIADTASTTATTANGTANSAKQIADKNKTDIADLNSRVTTIKSNTDNNTLSITNLSDTMSSLNTTVNSLVDSDFQTQIDTANADIGTRVENIKEVAKIWAGTQSEYNAISVKDTNTLYFIKEA